MTASRPSHAPRVSFKGFPEAFLASMAFAGSLGLARKQFGPGLADSEEE